MDNQSVDIEERERLLRLIDGDEKAFCELYAAYKNRLIYFAMQYLKSRDYAEDVFQDAFTVVWQGRRFINPDASFSAYLYTIVRNRVLNQLRSLQQEERLKEHILSEAVDADSAKDNLNVESLRELLTRAMSKLTPRQREVFELSREAELSHREIAEKLGLSVNTVQEHISLSLKTIRTYLKNYSDEYADLLILLICFNL